MRPNRAVLCTRASLYLLLLCVSNLSAAVRVVLTGGDAGVLTEAHQICDQLLPGECCKALQVPFSPYFNPSNPATADFSFLEPTDIAAVWGRRGNIRACSGVPLTTKVGPGDWHYEATGDKRAFGASYVKLPTALPPGETEANWLTAEGMLGLVWGGGQWFAKGASLADVGGSPSLKRVARRRVRSAQRGTAYIRGPRRWRWPDVVVFNGTSYVDAGAVELLYQSADGKVLNMTG